MSKFRTKLDTNELRTTKIRELDSPEMGSSYILVAVNSLWCRMQGFIRPVAHVGSGDPVRVLRLYTTNTLDEVCSIYC